MPTIKKVILVNEKRLRKQLEAVFNKMKNQIVKVLNKEDKAFEKKEFTLELDKIIDEGHLLIAKYLVKYTKTLIKTGAKDIDKNLNLGMSFDVVNELALKYVQEIENLHLSERDGSIKLTTKKIIYKLIDKGIQTGLTYGEIVQDIIKQGEHGVFSPARAEMIAVRELGNAYEFGKYVQINEYKQRTGNQVMKYWQTVEDSRVTKQCRENQAKGWILMNEAFPSGDKTAPRAGNPRCRCTTLYDVIRI